MDTEIAVRLVAFLTVFALVALWELLAPRRVLSTSKRKRWSSNLTIIGLNALAVRFVALVGLSMAPIGIAMLAQEGEWGFLHYWRMPDWLAVVVGVIVLDLVIYLQHVLFHAVPMLWRLHSMHHVDLDFDLTTGLRFHPIEILLSLVIKLAAVAMLGPPALAVLIFEVMLNGTAMFNHGNVRMPRRLDALLRLLVVTPDMHRVHHSVDSAETNTNFGFSLPWWDRLLGTYRAQPATGHQEMKIGLNGFRDANQLALSRLLIWPFVREPEGQ